MGRLHGLAGGDFPPEVDEMALAGLHPVPSVKVKAPRLAESAIHMECKLRQVVDITNAEGKPSTAIVIAEVLVFHVHHGVTTKSPTGKLVVDPVALAPISRMGGTTEGKPSTAIVIAEVVVFHVHHGVTTKSPTGKLVVDPVALAPISRMGGTTYARTTQLFDIGRPSAAQAQLGPADYTRPHVQQPAA
ncbi:flavin_Reduct domain-containing protein, partial [Haematococcus lacustris]